MLHRTAAAGRIDEAAATEVRTVVATASAHWTLCPMNAEIVESARRRFPREPIRSLDAIHIATAVHLRSMAPDLRVLSFDDRVLSNCHELGFEVLPKLSTD